MPPSSTQRNILSKSKSPILLLSLLGGASALFIGLKWRAVLQRSEAAKLASSRGGGAGRKEVDYAVVTGRSGGGI